MMKVLEQTVGIKVQAQLQYEFKTKGHMVDIGLALATQLKNGCITSQPSVKGVIALVVRWCTNHASGHWFDSWWGVI